MSLEPIIPERSHLTEKIYWLLLLVGLRNIYYFCRKSFTKVVNNVLQCLINSEFLRQIHELKF